MTRPLKPLSRRELLLVGAGGGLLLGLPGCGTGTEVDPPVVAPRPRTSFGAGCYAAGYQALQASDFDCGLSSTLGDPIVDQQGLQELAIQAQFWGFQVGFSPFFDCSGANAYSHPNGFILFGVALTQQTILSSGSTLPLAGILAHEWAHQVQFRNGYMNPNASTVRDTELEADAFSGVYMRIAKTWAGAQMSTYFATLARLGDFNFSQRSHHGTPNMRVAAGAIGMMAGDVILSGTPRTYADLHAEFQSAIVDIVACDGFCADPLAPKAGPEPAWRRLLTPDDVRLVVALRDGEASLADYLPAPTRPYDGRSPFA